MTPDKQYQIAELLAKGEKVELLARTPTEAAELAEFLLSLELDENDLIANAVIRIGRPLKEVLIDENGSSPIKICVDVLGDRFHELDKISKKDLESAATLALIEAASSYNASLGRFSTHLYQTVENAVWEEYRFVTNAEVRVPKKKVRSNAKFLDELPGDTASEFDGDEMRHVFKTTRTPEDIAIESEELAPLLDRLSERQRRVVCLAAHSFGWEAIAEDLKTTVDGAKSLHQRALAIMRR